MPSRSLQLILADNDIDDRMLFSEALEELSFKGKLITVDDGELLMELLTRQKEDLPDILFLDLNMPRKNGFECLSEIMKQQELQKLPVIIYSTSFESEMANKLFHNGAKYFIQKPAEFLTLKNVIALAIQLATNTEVEKPIWEKFILHP